jgi:hypothetical protein
MEHKAKTYFAENEYDDVKGFTVLKAEDGEYHIAEKWLATEENNADEDTWIDYLIPESDLLSREESGDCEKKGKLTDEQYGKVCESVEWYTDDTRVEA